ncbi:MAG: alpha-L-fucosidase [Armatimonadetes bacterium]|nr:alpha-L-fucosidase [Armatimonadota bacterium]
MSLAWLVGFSMVHQTQKFTSDWDSLKQYRCPEWFRDAKFGIWAHWGPQSVPMDGDWYARNMFIQGERQYEDHLKEYGHPSEHGYREIIEQWKCEKWNPDALMKLYKDTGAKYFVSMGVHHDNFDLWNSKYHTWNAVQHGPHRDVVGEWQKAAKKYGLKFGVSEHLGASYTWWRGSKGSDKTGPKAGVPYEGANPAYQELYHPLPAVDDNAWYSTNPAWQHEWSERINDLISSYKPDLLYSDGGVPFGAIGRQVVANHYNQHLDSKGVEQAVYLCKDMTSGEFVAGTCVTDRERGSMSEIYPFEWQTDTSVGDWFYNKHWPFRKADWILHTLIDVVSKNGNLLLNVVQRPDGSLDDDLVRTLHTVGGWLKANGESIYGTRPWLTFGEGPTKVGGGHFSEDFPFSAEDIRFATHGKTTLYATTLGAPKTDEVTIQSLARFDGVKGKVTKVVSLADKKELKFTHDATGLHIQLPAEARNGLAYAFKITCSDVNAFRPDLVPKPSSVALKADAKGAFDLSADKADVEGGVRVESRGGKRNFGFWDSSADKVTWRVKVDTAGTYEFGFAACTARSGTDLLCTITDAASHKAQKLTFKIVGNGSWEDFVAATPQSVTLPAGTYDVTLSAAVPDSWQPINLCDAFLRRQE